MSPIALLADGDAPLPPFTVATALTEWEPFQLLTLGLVVFTGLYLTGVVKLHRRGDKWPISRTLLFLIGGVLPIAYVTIGGIGAYDDQLLSVHMIQHMVLGMIAPIFLALGAPVTLALRTLPSRGRHMLVAVLHSRVVKVLAFPLVSFGLYVATPFALYFTGLYDETLHHEWFHDLTHIHFVIVGCLFFWPLISLDPLPGRWPYPARALLMLISTPFHVVLGLTIMDSAMLIGGSYYPSLHLAGVNALADQRVAGGILWAGGEVVSVTMLAALVIQWMRASDKETRRVDRQLDRQAAAERRARTVAAQATSTDEIGEDGMTTPWWVTQAEATPPQPADRSTATIVEQ
ncbi:MAG TPA: cytochrome c oxidase assembly protein [Micromonosporaceae bacterium]